MHINPKQEWQWGYGSWQEEHEGEKQNMRVKRDQMETVMFIKGVLLCR